MEMCVSVHHALWILCNSQYLDGNCATLYTDRWGKLRVSVHLAFMEIVYWYTQWSGWKWRFCTQSFDGNCLFVHTRLSSCVHAYTVLWWKTVYFWSTPIEGNQACLYPMFWLKNMHLFQDFYFYIPCYHDIYFCAHRTSLEFFCPPCLGSVLYFCTQCFHR